MQKLPAIYQKLSLILVFGPQLAINLLFLELFKLKPCINYYGKN